MICPVALTFYILANKYTLVTFVKRKIGVSLEEGVRNNPHVNVLLGSGLKDIQIKSSGLGI